MCLQFHRIIHKQFWVHRKKGGQPTTRSPKDENLEKSNNTNIKGVQLRDKAARLTVRYLHHRGVGLMSNLGMIIKVVLHSLVQFETRKTWSCVMP
jgi:hypothetical protein